MKAGARTPFPPVLDGFVTEITAISRCFHGVAQALQYSRVQVIHTSHTDLRLPYVYSVLWSQHMGTKLGSCVSPSRGGPRQRSRVHRSPGSEAEEKERGRENDRPCF